MLLMGRTVAVLVRELLAAVAVQVQKLLIDRVYFETGYSASLGWIASGGLS